VGVSKETRENVLYFKMSGRAFQPEGLTGHKSDYKLENTIFLLHTKVLKHITND